MRSSELTRSVTLLVTLARSDRQLYSRISEVWPIAPRGFALFDRGFKAVVYANAEDISAKYRNLYSVLSVENHPAIEYADLRFADRVIVKARAVAPSEVSDLVNSGPAADATASVDALRGDVRRLQVQN